MRCSIWILCPIWLFYTMIQRYPTKWQITLPYRTFSVLHQLLSLLPLFLRYKLKVRIEPITPEMSQRPSSTMQPRSDPLLGIVIMPDNIADESGDGQRQDGRNSWQYEDGNEGYVVLEREDEHGNENDRRDAGDQDPGHQEHNWADVRGALETATFAFDLWRGLAEFEFSGSAIKKDGYYILID